MGDYTNEHFLDIVNVSKIYPSRDGAFIVLQDFNLTIPTHKFTCLIGHSGCGKSTILTMVAGLNSISKGNICLDGKEISGPGPERAVVFQSPCLLPWLTAFDNVRLGVRQVMPQASRKEQDEVVADALRDVGLDDAMHKMPRELSQGMRQRVGIARAFALRPKLMLLDEPLGMLDALTKFELQDLIQKLHAEHKLTTLMVTHDVDEALYLSDRVVMMTNGPLAKVGGILDNHLPYPRIREEVLDHPAYYTQREELITFLEDQDEKHRKAS
jgi:nitrate ABC transporter ATP-binding subunit